jgi:hypothetical protein
VNSDSVLDGGVKKLIRPIGGDRHGATLLAGIFPAVDEYATHRSSLHRLPRSYFDRSAASNSAGLPVTGAAPCYLPSWQNFERRKPSSLLPTVGRRIVGEEIRIQSRIKVPAG